VFASHDVLNESNFRHLYYHIPNNMGDRDLIYYLTLNRWIETKALFKTHTKAKNKYCCMTVNNIMLNDVNVGEKYFSVVIFF